MTMMNTQRAKKNAALLQETARREPSPACNAMMVTTFLSRYTANQRSDTALLL